MIGNNATVVTKEMVRVGLKGCANSLVRPSLPAIAGLTPKGLTGCAATVLAVRNDVQGAVAWVNGHPGHEVMLDRLRLRQLRDSRPVPAAIG